MTRRRSAKAAQDELIAEIYDAALDDARWPDLLVRIADLAGGPGANLQIQDTATGEMLFLTTGGFDRQGLEDYASYFHRVDPRVSLSLRMPVGTIFKVDELLDLNEFRRSEIFSDFLRRYDLGSTLGGIVHLDSDIFAGFGVQRSLRRPTFTARDRDRIQALAPHLGRSARIRHTLGRAVAKEAALAEAVDRLPRGLLLADSRLRVLYANRYAEEVLAAADGLRLERGELTPAVRADRDLLRHWVRDLARGAPDGEASAGGFLALTRPSLRRPLELLVTPVTSALAALASRPPVCAIFVVDPDRRSRVGVDALRDLYHLTRAESRLAALLAEGIGLEAAAERLAITRDTAKTELQSVFAKTGTHRQAELAALLAAGLAPLAERP